VIKINIEKIPLNTYILSCIFFTLSFGLVYAQGSFSTLNQEELTEGFQMNCRYEILSDPYSSQGASISVNFDSRDYYECPPELLLGLHLESYLQPFDPEEIPEGIEYNCTYSPEPNQYQLEQGYITLILNSSRNFECPLDITLTFRNFPGAPIPNITESTDTVKTWELIEKGATQTYQVDNPNIAITSLSFTAASEIVLGSMDISSLYALPSTIQPPQGKRVYQYIEISAENMEQVSDVSLFYSVDKGWLSGINESSMRLYHYSGARWDELFTSLVGDTAETLSYESTAPSFGYFAIAGMQNAHAAQNVTSEKPPTVYVEENTAPMILVVFIFLALVVLVIAVVYLVMVSKRRD
jgi:PGF-pre-PGF domain-containing protein